MDSKQRIIKRKHIAQYIDVSHTHLNDRELNVLEDVIDHHDYYNGKFVALRPFEQPIKKDDSYCLRTAHYSYLLKAADDQVSIEMTYTWHDSDGKSGVRKKQLKTAREILGILYQFTGTVC